MHHWTDRKIRIHAFYCMLGISLLQYASVITSKPAICDHFKTGQRSWAQDMKLFYRVGTSSGKFFSISL
jgi:hypothetical protein